MKATFKVQRDVLSGLKYLQVVKRKGIRVGKDEEMIVSAGELWRSVPEGKRKLSRTVIGLLPAEY